MRKLLLLLILFSAIVGCSKSAKTIRASSNPQTTVSYSITPNKDVYEPGEQFVIEATINGQTAILGTPIEIFWEPIPSTLNDNNEFTPTISDNTLIFTSSAPSTSGEYIDITAIPIQIFINDIPQVTGNYTVRIITASPSAEDNSEEVSTEDNSSEEVSEYTPTTDEVNLIQSLNMAETAEFIYYDLNGDETTTPNQTIKLNSIKLGDTVTINWNTFKGQISTTSGDQVEMTILNSSTVTIGSVTNICKILGFDNGEEVYDTIVGDCDSSPGFSTEYIKGNTVYIIFGNSLEIMYNASLTFSNGTTFLLNGYVEVSSDLETPFEYNAKSHDDVPCNADVFGKFVLYTSDNTPITTTEDTESGYAEIIQYNINNGDESYYKVCL